MNNTALGNTSVLPLSDNFMDFYGSLMIHSFSLLARLPVDIFIIQLILSRRWIASEVYVFKEAIFAIMIRLYDVIRIASTFFPNKYLLNTRLFFEVIVVIGHSSLLTVTCVAQYLAVLKPLFFFKVKAIEVQTGISLYDLSVDADVLLWKFIIGCGIPARCCWADRCLQCNTTLLLCRYSLGIETASSGRDRRGERQDE